MSLSRGLAIAAAILATLGLGASSLGAAPAGSAAVALAALAALISGMLPARRAERLEPAAGLIVETPAAHPAVADNATENAASRASDIAPQRPDFPELGDASLRVRFARAIAASVPAYTEEAAFSLIDRFESMRGNTSRAAGAARDFKVALSVGQGSSSVPVAVQAERTRSAIKSQRESIAAMAEHNRKGAKDLRAMGAELESGMGLLRGIEEITERSRLIAFNMAVEAARIGEKGRGFRVIVGELRKLNDQTADFSHQVSDLLVRFRDYNESVVNRLAEETERVAKDVQIGMATAEEAVESLIRASASADGFSREVASLVETLDGDLDGVLESLQFQDITRQMIEGAVTVLDEIRLDLEKSLQRLGVTERVGGDTTRREKIRKELLDRSKTKGEKEAIMEVKS